MADEALPGATGFQIASAFVQVDPDAGSFAEQLEGELAEVKYVVTVPVVPDTADFKARVDSAVAESDSAVSVPVTPDTAGFKADVDSAVADSGAVATVPVEPDTADFRAKTEAAVADSGAVASVPLVPDSAGFAEKTVAESEAAGAESGSAFGDTFAAAAARVPLFGVSAEELDAAATESGATAGTGFASRFRAILGGLPLFGTAGEELDAGAAESGEAAGLSFAARFRAIAAGAFASVSGTFTAGASEMGAVAGGDAGKTFSERFSAMLGGASLMDALIPVGSIAVVAYLGEKFQTAMTMIVTQAGVAKSALGGLENSVLALSGKVGFSPDSLAASLYHVESSFQSVGISGPKAMDLLRTAAEGARVGGADLVDVQNALDVVIKAGIGGVQNYGQAMGALNAIVGSGDMTMQNLADAMGTGLIPIAKEYGQNIYQVGAALATFGDMNIRGAKAATDLRMAMQAIAAPVATGAAALAQLGLTQTSLYDTMEHHGLSAAIGEFIDRLKASKVPASDWGEYMTEIFGKRAGVGIGVLVGQFANLQSKLPDMEKGAHDFGSAWATTQQTTSQRLHELEGTFEALGTKLGLAMLPTINKIISDLTGFVTGAEKVGSAIWGIVGGPVKALYDGIDKISGLFNGLLGRLGKDVFGGLADSIGRLMHSAGSGKSLLSGLVGDANDLLQPVEQAFSQVKSFITSSFDGWWKSHGEEIKEVWNTVWTVIRDIFRVVWGDIEAVVKAAWPVIQQLLTIGMAVIEAVFKDGWDGIVAVLQIAWATIELVVKTAWDIIVGVFNVALDLLTGQWSKAWNDLLTMLQQVWNNISGYFVTIWNTISALFVRELHNLVSILSTAWNLIFADAKAGWDTIWSWLSGFWSNDIVGGIKSVLSTLRTDISDAWTDIKKDAVTAWDDIMKAISTPVGWLINDVYDKGIARLWNDTVAKVGGPSLPLVAFSGFSGGGRITKGAGPMADDVLIRASKGETVISAADSKTLAPAFAALGVPGYSLGGLIGSAADIAKMSLALATGNETAFSNNLTKAVSSSFGGGTAGAAAPLVSLMSALPEKVITGMVSAAWKEISGLGASKTGKGAKGGFTGTPPPGGAVQMLMQQMAAQRGWTGTQWTDLYNVEMREAGFSLTATNPGSGAYGLAQFINGPSEYAQYGGSATTAFGQITGMLNYIAERYGNPAAAWQSELTRGYYDQGGWLPPGASVAMNNTGQPERVIAPGSGAFNVNFYGTQYPSPEQVAALKMELASAVGVSG